jgi:uncharacterized NAD(P)/FAD-binding protein YdhS
VKIVAIVGFGFCGRLSFFHLVKKSDKNTKILIFDKAGRDALGAAFSSFSKDYILNVPAIKMSGFLDDPKNFCEFLKEKYPQVWQEIGGENGFAPRYIYGEYLKKITDEAFAIAKKNNVEVEFIESEVVVISEGFLIKTKDKKTYKSNEILIATSFNQTETFPKIKSKNFIKKIWDEDTLEFHQKIFDKNSANQKICIIGSGLTAIDVIIGLKKRNFAGKIFVISGRGNFPKKHFKEAQKNPDFILADDAENGLLFCCLKVRKFLRQNPDFDLRHVIDSIRPITAKLWQNFDKKNKKLFLRLLPYWNIFRHRAPIASLELVEEMIATNRLEIRHGGIKKISKEFECDYLVNCVGFEMRPEKYPLFSQMISEKLLKKDFFLVRSNHPKIHLLGGINIGQSFEITAVPDLRSNVEKVIELFQQ